MRISFPDFYVKTGVNRSNILLVFQAQEKVRFSPKFKLFFYFIFTIKSTFLKSGSMSADFDRDIL